MAEHKDEGLLDKILTLVAPPPSTSTQKGRHTSKKSRGSSSTASVPSGSSTTTSTTLRHTGMQNHPYCDACGDGGSLLCCDTCPASFHFNCCDPPIDPKNIPSGDWLCRHCQANPVGEGVPSLFQPLVESAVTSNPRVFSIPYEMQRRDILPGSSRKELKQARLYQHYDQEQCKYCYACNKNASRGRMVSCDFCPLIFHLDCLHPPLTIPPTTVWMCPVHPNAKITLINDWPSQKWTYTSSHWPVHKPGFDHPRLSQRLKALEKSQAEIPYHIIKANFIKQLRKIPHYKKITRHHNRRVTEVPAAVKCLYNNPLPDVSQVPSVADSMLTASEDMERWRMEEERNRKMFVTPRSPALTHNQDEWTRRVVLSHLYASSTPPQPHPLTHPSTHPSHDLSPSVLTAAQQLLELSAGTGQSQNHRSANQEGVGLHRAIKREAKSPPFMNGFVQSHPPRKDLVNGDCGNETEAMCLVDEDEAVNESSVMGNGGVLDSMDVDSVGGSVGKAVSDGCGSAQDSAQSPQKLKEEEQEEENMELGSGEDMFVPDLSQLDPKVVQLLAVQRLQQLLSPKPPLQTPKADPDPNHRLQTDTAAPQLNGWTEPSEDAPIKHHRDSMKGSFHSASALLCPLTGTSLASPIHKHVTSVGLGKGADVCLSEYGHCNFISSKHACIFYDKATQDYELINYSEHGTMVDGVLYSCDFNSSTLNPNQDIVLTLDDLSSLGKGRRASQARIRLERARESLTDKQEAKRALEAALRLSTPIKDDLSLAEEMSKCEGLMTRTGLKRVAATENAASGVNSSVVLSIPFSKTKKSDAVSKKGNARKQSPAKSAQREGAQRAVDLKTKKAVSSLARQEHFDPKTMSQTASGRSEAKKLSQKSVRLLQHQETPVLTASQQALLITPHHTPCGCDKSLSNALDSSGRGWEGTATLYHGSRLRFGCLQFILSLAGHPGHIQLLQALSNQLEEDL